VRRVTGIPRLLALPRDAHKGVRGRVLIVAGSLRMSGAARLAGWGALRSGAGLVTLAVPDAVHAVVAAELACAMTLPLPTRHGAIAAGGAALARETAAEVDAIAVGPGLSRHAGAFLRRFLKGLAAPLVLDADALNLVAEDPAMVEGATGPRILTPHPGEAARLLGREVGGGTEERVNAAREIAERYRATVILKGPASVVCDGESLHFNRTGNPGMATGGTGDVLTGILVARLAAGLSPLDAAVQAAHLHGRAGDLAAAAVGEQSMVATDLVASLAVAFAELAEPLVDHAAAAEKGSGVRRRGRRGR